MPIKIFRHVYGLKIQHQSYLSSVRPVRPRRLHLNVWASVAFKIFFKYQWKGASHSKYLVVRLSFVNEQHLVNKIMHYLYPIDVSIVCGYTSFDVELYHLNWFQFVLLLSACYQTVLDYIWSYVQLLLRANIILHFHQELCHHHKLPILQLGSANCYKMPRSIL